jgi:hypothetical protein
MVTQSFACYAKCSTKLVAVKWLSDSSFRGWYTAELVMLPILLLVPRNSSHGRGVIPSLAELGEQSYQLTTAWVLPVWNVVSWSVVRCIVRCAAY